MQGREAGDGRDGRVGLSERERQLISRATITTHECNAVQNATIHKLQPQPLVTCHLSSCQSVEGEQAAIRSTAYSLQAAKRWGKTMRVAANDFYRWWPGM